MCTLAQGTGAGGMGGASSASPGHEMQSSGASGERSEGGPGASGVSPGHEMREGEGGGGPGASRLAPGHDPDDRTAGFGGRDRDDRLRGDRDDRMMDKDTRGIDKQ